MPPVSIAAEHRRSRSECLFAESGTRPGLSGQTLVSTGLADFDKLLGGGLPLGTVTLLLEDTYTQHHVTLLKYFIAEGAAHNHALLWAAAQSQARALPQMVNHVSKVIDGTMLQCTVLNCHQGNSTNHTMQLSMYVEIIV